MSSVPCFAPHLRNNSHVLSALFIGYIVTKPTAGELKDMFAIPVLSKFSMIIVTFACLALMITFPHQTVQAALTGIGIWWDVLFPALFPFFIISELLLSLGIVHFFGTLLDPLMRPVFRIPGSGGFIMAMGFASGYPVSARLTSQLWEQRLISREEGERLVAFTSTSDPIFLIGAVAVGFFYHPGIALILCVAHYGSSIIVGLIMRFHERKAPLTPRKHLSSGNNLFLSALSNMHQARLAQQKPIGDILKDATITALKLIFVIGGLVVFFSVLIEQLRLTNILQWSSTVVSSFLSLAGWPEALSESFINGLFEVTLGAQSAGSATDVGLVYQVAAAAFVLSWAGLSVHAQIVSLMSHTGMRYRPFLIARLVHGLLAIWMVFVFWDLLSPEAQATFSLSDSLSGWFGWNYLYSSSAVMHGGPWYLFLFLIILLSLLTLISLLVHTSSRLFSKSGNDRRGKNQ